MKGRKSRDPHTSHDPFKMSASTRPVMAGDQSTLGDELILQISLNIFCFLIENQSPDQATISHITRLLSLWFMCKNNNRLISDE